MVRGLNYVSSWLRAGRARSVVAAVLLLGALAATSMMTTRETFAEEAATQPSVRFGWVEVFVDSGNAPLAAYQFELRANSGDVRIVGIEGGEHEAFSDPPYYDPAAMMKERVICAAFNTGNDLPSGRTRVARIHVQITGDIEPEYDTELTAAASADGERLVNAEVSVAKGEAR